MKNKLSILIRLVVSFGLLGVLFWIMRDDIKEIWHIIIKTDYSLILLAAVLLLINVVMLSYRFKIIFLGEDLNVNLRTSLELTLVGYFFNNFMPTAVGGDIVKGHYASHFTDNKKLQCFASVLMDRFIGLYTFLIVAAAALFVDKGHFDSPVVRPMVCILILCGILGIIVAANKNIKVFIEKIFKSMKMFQLGEKLNSVYNIVHDYRNRKDVVVKSFIISIAAQSIYFLIVYIFFKSLGAEVSLGNIFLIMPVVTFMSMIPSLGGLGVREGAIVAFFSSLSGKEAAFAVSFLILLGLLFISLLGGLVYLWWGIKGITYSANRA